MAFTTRSDQEVGWVDNGAEATSGRRLVLVLVGRYDLRAAIPLEYAWRVAATERRALHVVDDDAEAQALADAWMTYDVPLPLHMAEADGGLGPTVRRVVQFELASGFDEVVVMIGRVAIRRRHRWLHARRADAITKALEGLPGVAPAVMTVAVA
jgi:hypothetical protein